MVRIVGEIMRHPEEIIPVIKLKMVIKKAEKQIHRDKMRPHWQFCYSMLPKLSRGFSLVIPQLTHVHLRNAVCVFYLVLRALDTVEDDTSIAVDVKLPILKAFHRHIYNPDWHFSCGSKKVHKDLMDRFRHVSTAFLELGRSYQVLIEEMTKRTGVGMAKFICKEVETIEDYEEYCEYAAGLAGLGLSRLFYDSGLEDLPPHYLSISMAFFLQKTDIIRDYLEDINEMPKSRMFWPREIWSKYANKLEDLKYEENSQRAVYCLNEMVTNVLSHVEDCLKYMSALRDQAVFRFCAIPNVIYFGMLALCYNNVQVFRTEVKMRRGLIAVIVDRTNTMSDVYGACFDFACMIKSKVEKNDPNATKTLNRIEAIQKICRDSGTLNQRKLYVLRSSPVYNPTMMKLIFIALAIILSYQSITVN